jgi:hypothetical protein
MKFITTKPPTWYELIQGYFDIAVVLISLRLKKDLSHIGLKISDQPVTTHGKPAYDHTEDSLGSAATNAILPFIVIPTEPKFEKVMSVWGIPLKDKHSIAQHIVMHELVHFVVDTYSESSIHQQVKQLGDFETVYSKAVKKDKETLVEYLSYKLLGKLSPKDVVMTPEDLLAYMSVIKYGYISGTRKIYNIHDDHEFFNTYRLLSPSQVIKNKIGVCWDQCELERFMFANVINLPYTVYYMEADNSERASHTFLVFNNNGRYYHFEHSWESYRGIHEHKNLALCLKTLAKMQLTHAQAESNCTAVKVYVLQPPIYGSTCMYFMEHATKSKPVTSS